MFKIFVTLAALFIASHAHATSTINTNIPAQNSPLSSAPIRGNFQAAANDINNILGCFAGNSAPNLPTRYQLWCDTTTAPLTVVKQFDGLVWLPTGVINTVNHTYIPYASSSSIVGVAPVTVTFNNGVATVSLAAIPSGNVLANATAGAATPVGTAPTTWFDRAWCTSVGRIIVRTTGVWTCSAALPLDITWMGATCNGADDLAAIQAAINVGVPLSVPDGACHVSGTINIPVTATKITGKSIATSSIVATNTNLPIFSVADGAVSPVITDLTLSRTTVAISGGTGVRFLGSSDRGLLARLDVTKQYVGLVLGPTGNSAFVDSIVHDNLSDGVVVTNTAGSGSLLWGMDNVLSQNNAGRGFAALAVVGPGTVSLAPWSNVRARANVSYGAAFIGLNSTLMNGVQLNGGTMDANGNSGVYLDTYGGQHALNGVSSTRAGTAATGPGGGTLASGVGSGFDITANNLNVMANSVRAIGNSERGLRSLASVVTTVNSSEFNNNTLFGVVFVDGKKAILTTSVFITNGSGAKDVTTNPTSLTAANNYPLTVNVTGSSTVSVRNFGATCNAVEGLGLATGLDDFAAFQAAIAALPVMTGGTVRIDSVPGSNNCLLLKQGGLNPSLKLKSRVKIYGDPDIRVLFDGTPNGVNGYLDGVFVNHDQIQGNTDISLVGGFQMKAAGPSSGSLMAAFKRVKNLRVQVTGLDNNASTRFQCAYCTFADFTGSKTYYEFGPWTKILQPVQSVAITGTGAGAGGAVRLTMASTSLFASGNVFTVQGVLGTTEANGRWNVNVVDATHIDLVGSTFVNAYVSGGLIGNPWGFEDGLRLGSGTQFVQGEALQISSGDDALTMSNEPAETSLARTNYIAFGGTSTQGNLYTITFANAANTGWPQVVSYTIQSGDTLSQVALGLERAIKANAILTAAGATAQAIGPRLEVTETSVNAQTTQITVSASGGATIASSFATPIACTVPLATCTRLANGADITDVNISANVETRNGNGFRAYGEASMTGGYISRGKLSLTGAIQHEKDTGIALVDFSGRRSISDLTFDTLKLDWSGVTGVSAVALQGTNLISFYNVSGSFPNVQFAFNMTDAPNTKFYQPLVTGSTVNNFSFNSSSSGFGIYGGFIASAGNDNVSVIGNSNDGEISGVQFFGPGRSNIRIGGSSLGTTLQWNRHFTTGTGPAVKEEGGADYSQVYPQDTRGSSTGVDLSTKGANSRYYATPYYDASNFVALSDTANASVSSGNAQFPVSLRMLPSTHASSRRSALDYGGWRSMQDTAGNGTLDWCLYNVASTTCRLQLSTAGILTLSAYGTAGVLTNNSSGVVASNTKLPAGFFPDYVAQVSPVVTCGSGSLTSYTSAARYAVLGKLMDYSVTINITTNGTCASYLSTTLPFNANSTRILGGAETLAGGPPVRGRTIAASNQMSIVNWLTGLYPGADGYSFTVTGTIELP